MTEIRWAAVVLDADWTLVWVSEEMKDFVAERDDEKLGVGQHIVHAFLNHPPWLNKMSPESAMDLFREGFSYFKDDPESLQIVSSLPEPFRSLGDDVEGQPMGSILAASFEYAERELAPYKVNLIVFVLRDETGERAGAVITTTMNTSPWLTSLLARGNEDMYLRMARLIDPAPRQAVILFSDVEGSGDISRRLPSSAYFSLVRDLATSADSVVAGNQGIIGKHAGDGVSAFFLVNDLGSPSAAAAAAIESARAIQDAATEISYRIADDGLRLSLRMAIHWGSNLYMGQVVPGGRLDVSALGDEVNECARIQESAPGGEILVSKALIELLSPEDAKRVDVDVEGRVYRPLKELPTATEKGIRDAGGLAVAPLVPVQQ